MSAHSVSPPCARHDLGRQHRRLRGERHVRAVGVPALVPAQDLHRALVVGVERSVAAPVADRHRVEVGHDVLDLAEAPRERDLLVAASGAGPGRSAPRARGRRPRSPASRRARARRGARRRPRRPESPRQGWMRHAIAGNSSTGRCDLQSERTGRETARSRGDPRVPAKASRERGRHPLRRPVVLEPAYRAARGRLRAAAPRAADVLPPGVRAAAGVPPSARARATGR